MVYDLSYHHSLQLPQISIQVAPPKSKAALLDPLLTVLEVDVLSAGLDPPAE